LAKTCLIDYFVQVIRKSMAKPTQAHLSRTVDRTQSRFFRDRTLQQMEYYMGAKLLEVGINPQSSEIIYRWSSETKGNQEILTYSAYWGDSKERFLASEANQQGRVES
jgi:hypothetical protein